MSNKYFSGIEFFNENLADERNISELLGSVQMMFLMFNLQVKSFII